MYSVQYVEQKVGKIVKCATRCVDYLLYGMGSGSVCTTTDNGKRVLGQFCKQAREAQGWSLRDVVSVLDERTGFSISPGAIGDLEKGIREPQWNTLAKLVALGYIKNPATGVPYEVADLFKIACEVLDPETGEERVAASCNV